MKKQILLTGIGCLAILNIFSQTLFTYGTNKVSKEEFMMAFNRNMGTVQNKEAALKEYLELYSKFKLKVQAAKEQKLDTASRLKFDLMNFRRRLQNDYVVDTKELLKRLDFKRNPLLKDDYLFMYADSAAWGLPNQVVPVEKEVLFTLAGSSVKVSEWLGFAKKCKLADPAHPESNSELMEKFIAKSALAYYQAHLEDYNPDFTYRLQEFKEGNLLYDIMGRKVWNRSAADDKSLQDFYNAHKNLFVWKESAEVIVINAKSYAYADYASENLTAGKSWRKLAAESEGQIVSDSGRYEIAQLPVKPGSPLVEGSITPIVRNEGDESAGFIKVIKVYPANEQRSFEDAKTLVLNEYQKQLEESWMGELAKKYPVKVNSIVFDSLLK